MDLTSGDEEYLASDSVSVIIQLNLAERFGFEFSFAILKKLKELVSNEKEKVRKL